MNFRKVRIWDCFEYKVAEHYLSALINSDNSGMSHEEAHAFNMWEEVQHAHARSEGFEVGHWADMEDSGEDWGHCAITGLLAMRVTVRLMVYKEEERNVPDQFGPEYAMPAGWTMPEGFTDTSWRNDAAASIEGFGVRVWLDAARIEDREIDGGKRYMVQALSEEHSEGEVHLETDDWAEVSQFIEGLRVRTYRIEHFAPLYAPNCQEELPREFFSKEKGFDLDDQTKINALEIGQRLALACVRITRMADANDEESADDIEWDMQAQASRINANFWNRNGYGDKHEEREAARAVIREELRHMRKLQARYYSVSQREEDEERNKQAYPDQY